MKQYLSTFIIAAIAMLFTNCSDSDPRSSAEIPFTEAFAPAKIIGEQATIWEAQCSPAVNDVFDGKDPQFMAELPNNVVYRNPDLMASVFCLGSSGSAKSKYKESVDQLSNHPLGLKQHDDLKLAVPATGYWTDEKGGAKQVMFLYGNLVVIAQTHKESEISVDEVKKFAAEYISYLDGVAKIK